MNITKISELDALIILLRRELNVDASTKLTKTNVNRLFARSQGLKTYTLLLSSLPLTVDVSKDSRKLLRSDLIELHQKYFIDLDGLFHKLFGLELIFDSDIKPLDSTVVQIVRRIKKPLYEKVEKPTYSQSKLKSICKKENGIRLVENYYDPVISVVSVCNQLNLTLEDALGTIKTCQKEGSICRSKDELTEDNLNFPVWKYHRKLAHLNDNIWCGTLIKDPVNYCWDFIENHLLSILHSIGISSKDVLVRASGATIDDNTQRGLIHLSVEIIGNHGFSDRKVKALWVVLNKMISSIVGSDALQHMRIVDLNTGTLLSDYASTHKTVWDGSILKWEASSYMGKFRDDEYSEQCSEHRSYTPRQDKVEKKEKVNDFSMDSAIPYKLDAKIFKSSVNSMYFDRESSIMTFQVNNHDSVTDIGTLFPLKSDVILRDVSEFSYRNQQSMGVVAMYELWFRTLSACEMEESNYSFRGWRNYQHFSAEDLNGYVETVKNSRLAEQVKVERAKKKQPKKKSRYFSVYDIELYAEPILIALVKTTYNAINPTGYVMKNYRSLKTADGFHSYNSLITVPASDAQISITDSILAKNPKCYKKTIWFSSDITNRGYFVGSKFVNGSVELSRFGYHLLTDINLKPALHPIHQKAISIQTDLYRNDSIIPSEYIFVESDCVFTDLKRICIIAFKQYILDQNREVTFDNFSFSINDNGSPCISIDSKNNCGINMIINEDSFRITCSEITVDVQDLTIATSKYNSLVSLLYSLSTLSLYHFTHEDEEDVNSLISQCSKTLLSEIYVE
jgi:hypothetical protein